MSLYSQRLKKAGYWAEKIGKHSQVVIVALTGSTAEGKIKPNSDIDFFIQANPGRIWSARFWIVLKLILAGEYRREGRTAGKICPNWWATFNAPAKVGRKYRVLYQDQNKSRELKPNWLEKILRYLQIQRIKSDPRTNALGSQVRFSDQEIGFHPNKSLDS